MADFTKTPRPFYPKLSSENREVRLLHLQPGAPGDAADQVQCRLSVVSLDSDPSYEALSYRWGNGTARVLVDGHDVVIPQNLDEALRRFRHEDRERVLWADAICIDQSEVAERNAQVALMADIYRKCERCLVWMGKARGYGDSLDSGLGNLQELLVALSKKKHLNQPDSPQIDNWTFGLTSLPLMNLNRADWWWRIWVVQEVVLAPRSLVVFGSFEMQFSDLVDAVDFLNEHDIGSAWSARGPETDELCHCMDTIKVTFIWADLLTLRDRFYRLLELSRSQIETGNSNGSVSVPASRAPPDILDVLLSVRHRECTDPRDKIFGILSLVQDWGKWQPILADYSKDALQVFSEVAAQMVQSDCGPKTLLLARGANLPSKALTGLPTWVPDWTQDSSGYDRHLFTVERQTPQPQTDQPPASIHGRTLVLQRGMSRGKITSLSDPGVPLHKSYGQPPSQRNYDRFVGMLNSWGEFAGMSNVVTLKGVVMRHLGTREEEDARQGTEREGRVESGSYMRLMEDMRRSEHTVDFMPEIMNWLVWVYQLQDVLRRVEPDEEAFYRTLIHDTYPLHLRKPEYQKEALCILRLLLIFYAAFADPDRFLTRLNSVVLTKMAETLEMVDLPWKCLFRTEDGMLGIGPREMEVGDEVFLFEGVETPFVLRAVGMREVEGKGEQPCHELVGHCYVDGLGKGDGEDWQAGDVIYLQ